MEPNNPNQAEQAYEPTALRRLRRFVDGRRDLVSHGHVGQQIAALVADPAVRTKDLVDVALCDPAVVVRLIRTANGATYQNRDRDEVTTVQRATELLGQNQVRESVRSLPSFENTVAEDRLAITNRVMGRTIFCTRLTRNFLDTRNPMVSDEGAVVTTLANLWSIVGALHLPTESATMRFVKLHAPAQAEHVQRELFGLPALLLIKEIVESWVLPRTSHGILVQTEQRPTPAVAGRDWLPLAIGISLRVGDALDQHTPALREKALREVIIRYRRCVEMNESGLIDLIHACADETIGLERSVGLPESKRNAAQFLSPFLKQEASDDSAWDELAQADPTGVVSRVRAQMARQASNAARPEMVVRTATGKPVDCVEQLNLLTRQSQALCDDFLTAESIDHPAQDESTPYERIVQRVLPTAIEGLNRAMGFHRVAWFARVGDTDQYTPQVCAGTALNRLEIDSAPRLRCDGLFLAALIGKAEIHIPDCQQQQIADNLPDWFNQYFPTTRSFLLLPVCGKNQTFGFILADRSCTDPTGLEDAELSAILLIRDSIAALFDATCTDIQRAP